MSPRLHPQTHICGFDAAPAHARDLDPHPAPFDLDLEFRKPRTHTHAREAHPTHPGLFGVDLVSRRNAARGRVRARLRALPPACHPSREPVPLRGLRPGLATWNPWVVGV
jgi:hypothetical protein